MAVSLQIQSRRADLRKHSAELLRFAERVRGVVGLRGTVSLVIETDERMRAMNRYFRRKDKTTDVLSFPAPDELSEQHAGDIAISADVAATNALALGHTTAEEIKILMLHGMLHLAGHDHETDSGRMARLERRLRAQLRLPESLTERARVKAKVTSGKRATGAKNARIKSGTSPARRSTKVASPKNAIQ